MKKQMICAIAGFATATLVAGEAIPLPEHPRPDWQRAEWLNLNGSWRFAADKTDVGDHLELKDDGHLGAGLPRLGVLWSLHDGGGIVHVALASAAA